jgi:peptidoglycan/xylan/chitin deacetylase (PgdA/CDA1 family)
VGAIVSRVVSAAQPGSIVVMHVRTQTALALPAIIRGLQARHLRPSSLAEMFRAAGYR